MHKWYFDYKIVLTHCEKNLFSWLIKTFEIQDRSREFPMKGQYNFCTECFLTCSCRPLRSNTLEQLKPWKRRRAKHFLGCSFLACPFWILISCLLQKKTCKKIASQQTFGLSFLFWQSFRTQIGKTIGI